MNPKVSHEVNSFRETQARDLMNRGDYNNAIAMWTKILDADPEWEHGAAWNEVGFCYEEIGDFQSAQAAYKRALAIEPWNRHWNGSYCSFAYLHGLASSAYQLYLRYYQIEAYYQDLTVSEPTALLALGQKLGIPETTVMSDYAEAVQRGKSGSVPPREVPDAL